MPPTTLSGSITAGSSSFSIASASGAPPTPFVLKLDAGTAAEEKVLIGNLSGTSCSSLTRGYDNTTATSHSSGAAVEHDLAAVVIDDLNDHVYTTGRDDHTQYAKADGTRAFSGAVTVSAGGLTVSAGGVSVSAGGLSVASGNTTIQGLTTTGITSGAITSSSTITSASSVQGTVLTATLTGTNGRFVGATNGAPVSGTYVTGDFAIDPTNETVWICISSGTPGTWYSPQKPPSCRVYRNAAYTDVNTTRTLCPFDTVQWDTVSGYSAGTSLYTVPTAGIYLVQGGWTYTGGTGSNYLQVDIQHNGGVWSFGDAIPVDTSIATTATHHDLVQCAANDTLGLLYFDGGGHAIFPGSSQCFMSIVKVSN